MSQKLGTISIDLIANTVSFSDAMNKASAIALSSSRNIQRSLTMISVEATAMAASVIGSLAEMTAHAQEFAFTMQRTADSVGTSSEMFSKLAYNAKLAGIPMETLQMGMMRLARTAFSAKSGSKEMIDAYAAIGISVKDLNGPLKDNGDLTIAVAKKMDSYKESASKVGLEQKLLGRSGAQMNPLLRQLAEGFDTASQNATLFGVVVGDKTAAQALKLHQSIIELESVALGFSMRLLSEVSPALQDVSNQIIKVVTSSNGMQVIGTIAKDVAAAIRTTGNAFVFLTEHATAVKVALAGMLGLQLGSIFLPMIAGAAAASKGIGSIGLVAVKMIGKLSGITQIAGVFGPIMKGGLETARIIGMIAQSEGLAAAASTAWSYAMAPIALTLGTVTGAVALLSVGIVALGVHMHNTMSAAAEMSGGTVTWADHWNASVSQLIDRFRVLKLEMDKLFHTTDSADAETQNFVNKYGLMGKSIVQAVADAAAARRMGDSAITSATKTTQKPAAAKTDAPLLHEGPPEKIDKLKLKLAELATAADAARDGLLNAGKGVDFERATQITQEYQKTLIELNEQLKVHGKTVSDAQAAALLESIATRINDEAQAKFLDTIAKGTETIKAQTNAHTVLTAAIGMSAAANRKAQVDSEIDAKYANASDTFKNSDAGRKAIDDEKVARTKELAAADAQADKQAMAGVQEQIAAQMRLNDAILKGKDARDAANLATEQAGIRKSFADKGDDNSKALNDALAANEQLFELKQKQADLSRANAMDPAKAFQEEAKALHDAAQAARDAGDAIGQMQLKAAAKANWDSYLESINKTTLAVGSASDGVSVFFNQMVDQTQSAAQQMHDILGGAFESLNGTLEKLISGKKASFADMFRGIASQLGKIGIQKAESSIASALGAGHKKPTDGTVAALATTNNYLAGILAAVSDPLKGGSQTGIGNILSSGTAGAKSGIGSAIGGLSGLASLIPGVGPFASLFGGMFGGHRALGGDVTAGMSYDVGEMGRETFTPKTNGSITANNKRGGGDTHLHIDARGAHDPAQTEAAIHRAMGQYAPHIIGASVKAVHEHAARRPASARG